MAGSRKDGKKSRKLTGQWEEKPNLLDTDFAARRALAIPELLELILDGGNKDLCANCARVCRPWSGTALKTLWHSMESIVPLLELVFPLESTSVEGGYLWDYGMHLSETKWDRFRFYAEMVRSLKFSEGDPIHDKKNSTISHTTFAWISLFHPFGTPLLPHLRSLIWMGLYDSTIFSMLPFISNTLIDFTLKLDDKITKPQTNRLLSSLVGRMPNLEKFGFRSTYPASAIHANLSDMIEAAPQLKTIRLPRFYHTRELVGALGKVQGLVQLNFNWDSVAEEQHTGKSFRFSDGTFPQLRTLECDLSMSDALHVLSDTPDRFGQLEVIVLGCARFGTEVELRQLFLNLGRCCEKIKIVGIDFTSSSDTPTSPAFSFDALHPLFNCRDIESLTIEDDRPLSLEEKDVRAIGEAWPKLVNLSLIQEPRPQNAVKGSGTALAMLKVFAACCPTLEKLGLFFDEGITLDFDGDPNPKHQFGLLRALLVGASVVPQGDIDQLGFHIGSLCSEVLIIDTNNPWGRGQKEADRASEWMEALRLSKLVMKAKASVRKLEKKVADLEASNELLRGHADS